MSSTSAPWPEDLPGTRGVLRVFRHPAGLREHGPPPAGPDPSDPDPGEAGEAGEAGFRRVWTFVPGSDYPGMEDNDLRGFLDGRFNCGWNQPGQAHVRVGRVGTEPGSSAPPGRVPPYGEHELFRALQRWNRLRLPSTARILRCRLHLTVERARPFPVQVVLYAVKKDWNPGGGGVEGNNVSVPKPGEVWWNEAAFGERSWGLPGAGFSADRPDADTGAMPLAEAVVRREGQVLEFASPRLDAYARERVPEGLPLLFLLKASDHQEDVPGTVVALYSANFGDSRSRGRRPRLSLEWTDPFEELWWEKEVFLEHGRRWAPPAIPVAPDRGPYTVDFGLEDGYQAPTLEVSWGRGEEGDGSSRWLPARGLLAPEGDRLRVRMVAGEDPIPLGDAFTADLRDTWVLTAPPEEQRIRWSFTAPSGEEHRMDAEYVGDYTWRVRFVPEEPGAWSYRWRHRLTGEPVKGGPGRFVVVADDLEALRSALGRLEAEIREVDVDRASRAFDPFRGRFCRLQRAAVTLLGPGGYRGPEGDELRRALDDVRARLWGKPLPEESPLESMPLRREVAGRKLEDPVPRAGHIEFRASWGPDARGAAPEETAGKDDTRGDGGFVDGVLRRARHVLSRAVRMRRSRGSEDDRTMAASRHEVRE